jgi:hypothetical protein
MPRLHTPSQFIIRPLNYGAPPRGPSAGGLGPIGSDADRRGATDGVADWTDLLDYYGRAGFTVWKRYAVCRGWKPRSVV